MAVQEPNSMITDDATNPAKNPSAENSSLPLRSLEFVSDILQKAELLLSYAAEAGIAVDEKARDGVLRARFAIKHRTISERTVANLLAASTTLAATVSPMTAESLGTRVDLKTDRKTILNYGRVAIIAGFVIVMFSLLTFVTDRVSDQISTDVKTANGLAAKLRVELGPWPAENPSATDATTGTNNAGNLSKDAIWFGSHGIPPGLTDIDVIGDLQEFAATMREINGYTKLLKYYVLDFSHDSRLSGSSLELTAGLNVRLAQEFTEKIQEYQIVRASGNKIVEKVAVYYGAIATHVFPVLYALLGAVAYLLRNYENDDNPLQHHTLVGSHHHLARFMIAGIGGLVVGLFNGLFNLTQGVNISPFAVAFLVGYAVDVFFAFLDGLPQMFKPAPRNSGGQGTPPKQS